MGRKRENRRYGSNLPGLLLVEGVNDLNFLCQLFVKRGIYEYDKKASEFIPKIFSSVEKGSYSELKNGLAEELKDESLETVGVIVDADEKINKRWEDLRKHFCELGYLNIPSEPDAQGCIFQGDKRIGIWLMPDNKSDDIIERFIGRMIHNREPDRLLWTHVENSINSIPGNPRFFQKDLAKAQVATWLAWQENPGYPISYAIFKEYVDPMSESADLFIAWIRRLFQLP